MKVRKERDLLRQVELATAHPYPDTRVAMLRRHFESIKAQWSSGSASEVAWIATMEQMIERLENRSLPESGLD